MSAAGAFRTFWLQALLVAALVIAGASLGRWVGKWAAIESDRGHMLAFANQLLKRGEKVFAEADSVLAQANGSPFAFCSSQEVAFLRDILFTSRYLKDVGRVSDGKFHCSAVFGPAQTPAPLPSPDETAIDGSLIYALVPLAVSKSSAPIIGHLNANVVLDPTAFDSFADPAYVFGILLEPGDGRNPVGMFGVLYQGIQPAGFPQGLGRDGDSIFRNLCSGRVCVAVHAKVADLEAAMSTSLFALIGLGGALGGAMGCILLLLQRKGVTMKARLSNALKKGVLELEYQPIVNLHTGAVVGAEALLRWTENNEVISPDVFIPVAEEADIVQQVTLYVIDRLLLEMAGFLQSHPDFRLNVNISANDLCDPGFGAKIAARLEAASVLPTQLALEITERSSANASEAIEAIRSLRSRGHSIYIDDFGTGYSSLSYLGQLNVDGIKIDKSFTQKVGTDAIGVSIAPQIVDMARAHDLAIVVEGIETERQREYFANLKMEINAQGWLFGKPVSASKIADLFSARGGSVRSATR
ncbi:EAL domain-containing protein [Phyllobacterium myrsinacearum]|uniref:cyclic-guanylate-specific phosphodiesterase n=1 Tax=Phyllobacterium myrsinacearum TaxID=28101 RepID=A0A839EJM5_9HYPH|nr:EAL domain-containing protein [Phyllobacterium myrsinacearum]MBA8878999.1 sensor c-di-GMP phosphodiesterase-like protein [Phyllobacterium myrsinacearum]